ncbi:MAG TPA: lantibiotic dehydratase [Candidatus Angelobacter sp.]|jgi:hypothetical protein
MNLRGAQDPIIARLSGLSCSIIEGLATSLSEQLDRIDELEKTYRKKCDDLVDRLFAAIHGAEPQVRHALLAVKRDCYNGRSLSAYQQKPEWRLVEAAAGNLANQVVETERTIRAAKLAFAAAFEKAVTDQQQLLASVLNQPMFTCGLAVSSGVVAKEVGRLRQVGPKDYGRREKRLVSTLLRYVSRAALKLSPFSTFTPVGLCHVKDDVTSLTLAPGAWSHRSLVRLRRHVFDRCGDMLLRYRPWRDRCAVAVSNSVITMQDGRLLFRRGGHYRHDPQDNKLLYHKESLVRISLTDDLADRAQKLLALGSMPYGELVCALSGKAPEDAAFTDTAARLDELIDLGFLNLITPWHADEGHLERTMVHDLRLLPPDQELKSFIGLLERLLVLEDGFLESKDPTGSFVELNQLVSSLLQSAAKLGKMPEGMSFPVISYHDIYQDVWCAPKDRCNAPVVRAPKRPLQQALRSIAPIVRFARLFDHQIDFLYTLGAFLREQYPDRRQIPVLEAIDKSRLLWQDFMKFQKQTRDGESWKGTWNPRGLDVLKRLAVTRESAVSALNSCLREGKDAHYVSADALNAALANVPGKFFAGHCGASLFLQAGSADGSLWVLNRVKEGTGRFASRYTPLMTADLQEDYARHLSDRGTFVMDGEEVPLLDIQHIQGDTLNVHVQQTPKVLTLTGARAGVPADQRVTLRELVITLQADGWPEIRELKGQRFLPIYLGVGSYDYMPTLVKFLCSFGPTELMAIFPKPFTREVDGMVEQDRTIIGNVVLHRRAWSMPMAELRQCLDQPNDVEVFRAIHQWRRRRGLPERAFVDERALHPLVKSYRIKPQYVDFTSPLFIPILRAIAAGDLERFHLDEVLPGADAFPKDSQGESWAVELLVDSLPLRPAARVEAEETEPTDIKVMPGDHHRHSIAGD